MPERLAGRASEDRPGNVSVSLRSGAHAIAVVPSAEVTDAIADHAATWTTRGPRVLPDASAAASARPRHAASGAVAPMPRAIRRKMPRHRGGVGPRAAGRVMDAALRQAPRCRPARRGWQRAEAFESGHLIEATAAVIAERRLDAVRLLRGHRRRGDGARVPARSVTPRYADRPVDAGEYGAPRRSRATGHGRSDVRQQRRATGRPRWPPRETILCSAMACNQRKTVR